MRILLSALLLAMATGTGEPQVSIQVEHWKYDPQVRTIKFTLANTSLKEITALSLRVRATYSDGSVNVSTTTTDFYQLIVSIDRTNDPQLRAMAFMPGTAHEMLIGAAQDVVEASATATNVVYADGTADVGDEETFGALVAHRKGDVLAMQKAADILKAASSRAAAINELNRAAEALRGKNLAIDDPEAWIANYLDEVKRRIEREPETSLATIVKDQERASVVAGPHAQLRRTGAQ
jgi:hypothetical protein